MSEIPATFCQNTTTVSAGSLSAKLHYEHVNLPHSTINRFLYYTQDKKYCQSN